MVGKLKMANSYIPFEMQEEIMKRLPVKSLLRFRSVSKHWKSLIHSSKFIVDYRVQKHRLLVRYADTENGYYTEPKYVSIADDDTFPRQKHDLTFPMSLKSSVRKSMGNSHGLLCFSYGKVVVIWNPTIQKTVSIDVHDALDLPYETFYGFGVCLDTCDPKLVKMIFDSNLKESYTVEIFTLSSGVWRLPHSNLPRKSICFTHCRVYVDGRIYWCAYDYVRLPDGLFQRSKMIMSFATTSEEFTEISFPNSLALKAGIGLGITKLRDSLIVVEIILNDQVYGIWMMKNHGDPKSFTKLFNINFNINLADASMIPVIGFRNSGEAIVRMKNDDSDALYVYEPNTKHISFFGISHPYSLSSYTETLLLLDH